MRRCCRDSVAWDIARDPQRVFPEGHVTPCRWCSGYARFEGGDWHYQEDESMHRQAITLGDLVDHPVRQARLAEILGKPQP